MFAFSLPTVGRNAFWHSPSVGEDTRVCHNILFGVAIELDIYYAVVTSIDANLALLRRGQRAPDLYMLEARCG